MDINTIATEFVEVNQRRRELEKREEYLKGILADHFQATKTLSLDTDTGTIRYQASQHTDYDVPLLREILPESIFQLVTRLSVNDALLTQLIKDGKVDDTKVARARRATSVYRIVVQFPADRPLIRPVSKESPVAPPVASPVQPPRKKKTQSTTRSQRVKAETRPPVDLQKTEEQPKETKQPPKRSRKPRAKKPPS